MTSPTFRVQARVVLLVFMLTALSATLPSGSLPALDFDALDSGDLKVIEDVTRWVDPEVSPLDGISVRDEIRQRATGFEVFRSFHERADRHAYLVSLPYGELVRIVSSRYGVDSLLLAAVIEAESGFDAEALSHRGAVGLMQILPTTAGLESGELMDPSTNIDRGARYLRQLLERFDGDLELALAAYNAGPANVRRYGGVPPFAETQAYLEKVLRIYVDHHRAVWQASDEVRLLLGEAETETAAASVQVTT